jgi:hypothetical protein
LYKNSDLIGRKQHFAAIRMLFAWISGRSGVKKAVFIHQENG